MSGGHFCDCGYDYYKVAQFADELEYEIASNFTKDEHGYAYEYPEEVVNYLTAQVPRLRRMAEIMRHIDYLYSGDHGSDSFISIVEQTERKYQDYVQQLLNNPNVNLNDRITVALREAIEEYD
jgi:hypothetical protein